jgi:hypothetical protein
LTKLKKMSLFITQKSTEPHFKESAEVNQGLNRGCLVRLSLSDSKIPSCWSAELSTIEAQILHERSAIRSLPLANVFRSMISTRAAISIGQSHRIQQSRQAPGGDRATETAPRRYEQFQSK